MAFDIAPYIDHTILKPDITAAQIRKLCNEAVEYGFAAVCVPPYYVKTARKHLGDESPVKLATVIGFPMGYSCTEAKIAEIKQAVDDDVDELDMVHSLAAVKNTDWGYLEKEVTECLIHTHQYHKKIKIIIETGSLTDEEIIKCCELYCDFNIDFLKTSTGFTETGATVHAVELMRKHLPQKIAIKASGGIRNFRSAKELIDAGATRIGSSAGVQIVQESKGTL